MFYFITATAYVLLDSPFEPMKNANRHNVYSGLIMAVNLKTVKVIFNSSLFSDLNINVEIYVMKLRFLSFIRSRIFVKI